MSVRSSQCVENAQSGSSQCARGRDTLLTVVAGAVIGTPALIAACRAGACPRLADRTLPMKTSSTSAAGTRPDHATSGPDSERAEKDACADHVRVCWMAGITVGRNHLSHQPLIVGNMRGACTIGLDSSRLHRTIGSADILPEWYTVGLHVSGPRNNHSPRSSAARIAVAPSSTAEYCASPTRGSQSESAKTKVVSWRLMKGRSSVVNGVPPPHNCPQPT